MTMTYTAETLPNGLPTLRTGTANDGRALIHIGRGERAVSSLRDLRSRLPDGWTAEVYAASGVDAVLTHVGQ